ISRPPTSLSMSHKANTSLFHTGRGGGEKLSKKIHLKKRAVSGRPPGNRAQSCGATNSKRNSRRNAATAPPPGSERVTYLLNESFWRTMTPPMRVLLLAMAAFWILLQLKMYHFLQGAPIAEPDASGYLHYPAEAELSFQNSPHCEAPFADLRA